MNIGNSSCFKTSDNKHLQCPPRMSDGRHFSDYRSSDYINDLIRADNNISNSLHYRVFLQNNADALMDRQRQIACQLNCCGPCPITQSSKEPFGTMLPEQYMFVTDGRTTKYVLNDVNGIPYNLTNYSIKSQFKKSYYSTSSTDFTVVVNSPSSGIISLNLDSATSANVAPGKYVYDVLLNNTHDNTKTRILEGVLNVTPAVSHF